MWEVDRPLSVSFAGLALPSPVVAASAPPTESAAGMIACAKAGAGAVVTKSVVDYARADWPDIPRRVRKDRKGLWIQGSFSSETLTLAEGVATIASARDSVDVPIFASVGVLDPRDDSAIETALSLVRAGATMIHFDLFYLPQPRCGDSAIRALKDFFDRARAALPVPFAPKLNMDFPAHYFAASFDPSSFDGLFLLDSIRVPPPVGADGQPRIAAWHGGLECSLFGEWQKPITLQYTRILAEAGMPDLCSGGGLRSAADILEAMLLGATCAQVASQIMIHGYDWIRKTNDQLAGLIEEHGHADGRAVRGFALRTRDKQAPEGVTPMRALVDPSRCEPCGVCTKLAFCPHIEAQPTGIPIIGEACYGCGLCEQFCPHDGAIFMEAVA
jgi:dihydroorotate dehydrogenase/NAD-dependent dihydropyrimidine dehydrogenase PreA subunit